MGTSWLKWASIGLMLSPVVLFSYSVYLLAYPPTALDSVSGFVARCSMVIVAFFLALIGLFSSIRILSTNDPIEYQRALRSVLEMVNPFADRRAAGPRGGGRIKILFVGVDPYPAHPKQRIDVKGEAAAIDAAVRDSLAFRLICRFDLTESALQQLLHDERPAILHFCGHGAEKQGLVLYPEGGYNHSPIVPLPNILRYLEGAGNCRCIYLNACYSLWLAEGMVCHTTACVENCIGSAGKPNHVPSIACAKAFYERLCRGETIEAALRYAVGAYKRADKSAEDDQIPELREREPGRSGKWSFVSPDNAPRSDG